MKTSTIPSIRVEPELQQAAESVLRNNENLSSFVAQSLRVNINRRLAQQEFIAHGLTSQDEARRTVEYYEAEDVLQELDDMLARAES